MENTGNSLYEGSATIGRAQSYIGLFIFGFISLILVIVAIYLFTINESNLIDTQATVINAQCQQNYGSAGKSRTYSCNVQIKYVVNGTEYNGNISTNGPDMYYSGNVIDVTYDSNNPNIVTTKKLRDKLLAFILLGIAILLGGGAYFNYYMTSKSKAYAAFSGASSTLRMI